MYLCIEILGESAFHQFLIQSGWSGRDYVFRYNRPTGSHLRAYRTLEEYLAERVDLHKSSNIWPLLANWLPQECVEEHVFVDAEAKLAKGMLPRGASETDGERNELPKTMNATADIDEGETAWEPPRECGADAAVAIASASAHAKTSVHLKRAKPETRGESAAVQAVHGETAPSEGCRACESNPEISVRPAFSLNLDTPEPLCH